MSKFIPVSADGKDPIALVKPYFVDVDEENIIKLVGTILILRNLSVRQLQNILNLPKIETLTLLGYLKQSELMEFEFTQSIIKFIKINERILKQTIELTQDELTFLGYLKARYTISYEELENAFSLNKDVIVIILARFICYGLISTDVIDNKSFNIIVYYKSAKHDWYEVTETEKKIMGYILLRPNTTLKNIANALGMNYAEIQNTLINLILSDMIICDFNLHHGIFKSTDVSVTIQSMLINFEKREINLLSPEERAVIGYVSLRGTVLLHEVIQILEIPKERLITIIATLTATREFEFSLSDKNHIIPVSVPVFPVNRSIDDLNAHSIINYRTLIGILKSDTEAEIDKIAEKMHLNSLIVLQGIIELYLNGFISGRLENPNKFVKKGTRDKAIETREVLKDWEKITIGALIAEKKLRIQKLSYYLNVSYNEALEKAYAFSTKGIGDVIVRNKIIILKDKPTIPPLIQIIDLSELEQKIFGYMVMRKQIQIKHLKSLFDLDEPNQYSIIYKLIGSGLFVVVKNGGMFKLEHVKISKPILSIEELKYNSRIIIDYFENSDKNKYRLSKLAYKLKFTINELKQELGLLIGLGYYKGTIQGKYFIKESDLIQSAERPRCFNCHKIIKDYRKPCPYCLAPPKLCSVCRSGVSSTEKLSKCPHCNNIAHTNHIIEWLNIKGICPICRNKLSPDELIMI